MDSGSGLKVFQVEGLSSGMLVAGRSVKCAKGLRFGRLQESLSGAPYASRRY